MPRQLRAPPSGSYRKYGNDAKTAAEWTQAAGNVLTTGTALVDVGRYTHSGQHPQSREHAYYAVDNERLKRVAEEYAKGVDAQASSGSHNSNTAYAQQTQGSDQNYQPPPAQLSERQRGKLPEGSTKR